MIRLLLATDFGTTTTSISWTIFDQNPLKQRVHVIGQYPQDSLYKGNATEVPTEIAYLRPDPRDRNTPNFGSRARSATALSSDSERERNVLQLIKRRSERRVLWGYQVQNAVSHGHLDPAELWKFRVERLKLLLDNSETTSEERLKLRETARFLKDQGLIRDEDDILIDFLTPVLQHAKKQIEKELEKEFKNKRIPAYEVEFVLTFPPTWSIESKQRMDRVLLEAVRNAKFRKAASGILLNFVHISEPEAAAVYVLEYASVDDWVEKNLLVSFLRVL
jgi:hypothetical protein